MKKNSSALNILDRFHPLIASWFREKYGSPTDIQHKAWPEIAEGKHVLVTAPTGSGKTLTAFLWAINTFVTAKSSDQAKRVLYISPLKALNNDIRRNLNEPLDSLRELFSSENEPFPEIRTAVRSGDTAQKDRRRHIKRPPDIYITTPESLNLLLSSKSGKRLLEGIGTVILDEIHAVADTKRGAYLMSAIERLTGYSGEFQRIALSATVKPLDTIASFIGGFRQIGDRMEPVFEKRPVELIRSNDIKKYDISIDFPDPELSPDNEKMWWDVVINSLRAEIADNRSTLVFANSRRMVEKITRLINEREAEQHVYSHHGSLSREIREVVEQRLKNGELNAIVATSSLELGIDIGDVDSVALVQTPYSIASAIQRIGRAGHGVGQVSKGGFFPIHQRDLLQATVLSDFIGGEDIESISPVEQPLDVLSQLILSMTLHEEMNLDALYAEIRCSWAFRKLTRKEFDIVVEMLAGRYADSRIRELKPRLSVDRINNTAKARDNVAPLLYMSGGVIPDRGYYNLRVADSKARIGELDEEFVWERSLGDAFPFGNQIWQIVRITHNDVEVRQVKNSNTLIPFWKAEDMNRSWHFSEKIGEFLENAETRIKDKAFASTLATEHRMTVNAAESLTEQLSKQIEATGVLPHRHRVVVEHFNDPANLSDTKQTVLHTMWGGAVNRPLAFALAAAWDEKYGYTLEAFADNDCIMLNLPHDFGTDDILALAEPGDIARLLRKRLESTGYFGARFRENAQRAMLLPRRNFHDRMPLWLNRLRSKKLLEAVSKYDDFPIVLETWRECLKSDFDIAGLDRLLEEIRSGTIEVTEVETRTPSPFASEIIWRQTNHYMYADDTPGAGLKSSLSDELIQEVLESEQLRPRFTENLIETFNGKIQRTAVGYTPDNAVELLEWVKDRLLIPYEEWLDLKNAIERDHDVNSDVIVDEIKDRLHFIMDNDIVSAVCALEELPRISAALGIEKVKAAEISNALQVPHQDSDDPPLIAFLTSWLRYYGPLSLDTISAKLHCDAKPLSNALTILVDDGTLMYDSFREAVETIEFCDRENLEILLRMRRKAAQPVFDTLEIEKLPLFLAAWQGIIPHGESIDDLEERLEKLLGYPARAALWEQEILPARLAPYYTVWLDQAMRDSGLMWLGCGKDKLSFAFKEDLPMFRLDVHDSSEEKENNGHDKIVQFMQQTPGKVSLSDIADAASLSMDKASTALWELSWQGKVSNDDFNSLRKGLMCKFKAEKVSIENNRGHRKRSGFSRWKNTRAFSGHWFPTSSENSEEIDTLANEELIRDRIRQLFMRYGILYREILKNEIPALQWKNVFRSLRLMEFSGEIVSGYFFKDIPGVQFCSHSALRFLNRGLPQGSIYWMSAADPASFAGIALDKLKGQLPDRLPSNHIVFHDEKVTLISKRNGRELLFNVPPDHPDIKDYLAFFSTLLGRQFQPLKSVSAETVNGEEAVGCPYESVMRETGFTKDYKTLILRKQYS